jgi:chromosome segregation ATPase
MTRSTRRHDRDQRWLLATREHSCEWRSKVTELETKLDDKDAQLEALNARINQTSTS